MESDISDILGCAGMGGSLEVRIRTCAALQFGLKGGRLPMTVHYPLPTYAAILEANWMPRW